MVARYLTSKERGIAKKTFTQIKEFHKLLYQRQKVESNKPVSLVYLEVKKKPKNYASSNKTMIR